jgi:hypothetical protein
MFGLETLDLLIGLVTIYLAFAVACTAIVEALSAWLRLRARNLEEAMGEFLSGELDGREPFVRAFYANPLIQSLSQGRDGRPSYLPPALVGQVVESVLLAKTTAGVAADTAAQLRQAIDALPEEVPSADGSSTEPNRVRGLLLALLDGAEKKGGAILEDFRRAVSAHFDQTMDRASGWFKRKVQLVTLCVSAVLVLANNVDTVAIARVLAADAESRGALVGLAEAQVDAADRLAQAADGPRASEAPGTEAAPAVLPSTGAAEPALATGADPARLIEQATRQTAQAVAALEDAARTLESAEMPLGWSAAAVPTSAEGWLAKLAGLSVSVFAVMLGAPFWFGVLQQLNAVRSTGTVPRSGTDEAGGS